MIKRILLYLLVLIILPGCNRKPLSVLSHKEMVDVLLDVHLTEATLNTIDPYSDRIEKQEYYNSIFIKHNITKEDFDRSIDWYARHPKKMIAIYDDLKQKTSKLCLDIENYKYHPNLIPTHNDSIDTFDIWKWRRAQLLIIEDSLITNQDTLHYRLNNKNYYNRSERIDFYLKMRVSSKCKDSIFFNTRILFYSDTIVDTLQYKSMADSLCRRYNFHKYCCDTSDIDSIDIQIVDCFNCINKIEIDSIELNRIFNNFEFPMDYNVKKEIREKNDSIIKLMEIEKLEKDKNKENIKSKLRDEKQGCRQ